MIFQKFNWKPIELNFVTPIKTSGAILKKRNIYLVELSDSNNNKFYGECAPLPQFGSESIGELETALYKCSQIIIDKKLDELVFSLDDFLNQWNDTPTLRAAIEQSILSALKFYDVKLLWEILPKPSSAKIKVNAFVDIRSPFNTAETSLIFKETGFDTIKLKMGREDFSIDLEALKRTRKAVGQETKLRVDINGKWNLSEAEKNISELEKFNLEYAEQPVAETQDLIELAQVSKTPIAADESIRRIIDAERIIESEVSCLVIKPALLGGITNTLKVIGIAKAANKTIVISSSFESALSRYNLLYLAALTEKQTAHGITLSNRFEEDLFEDELTITNGTLQFKTSQFLRDVNLSEIFSSD